MQVMIFNHKLTSKYVVNLSVKIVISVDNNNIFKISFIFKYSYVTHHSDTILKEMVRSGSMLLKPLSFDLEVVQCASIN